MSVYEINSDSAWEEYSDGFKEEHQEIAFEVNLGGLINKGITIQNLHKNVEKLYLIGKLNPQNEFYQKYKKIIDRCIFDGVSKTLWLDEIEMLNEVHPEEELEKELSLLQNKNVFIQNRIKWESNINIVVSSYRRLGLHITDKSIKHIKV